MIDASTTKSSPTFVIVFFGREQAAIVAQGVMSETTFEKQFLEPYDLRGERYHPGQGALIRGVLLATNGAAFATVPIWVWAVADGTRFLCQATDDGHAPAFSVFASSENELLDRVSKELQSL